MQKSLTARVHIHTSSYRRRHSIVWPQYTRNTNAAMLAILGNVLGALIPLLGRSRPNCNTVCAWWAYTASCRKQTHSFKPFGCKSIEMNAMHGVRKQICITNRRLQLSNNETGTTQATSLKSTNFVNLVQNISKRMLVTSTCK